MRVWQATGALVIFLILGSCAAGPLINPVKSAASDYFSGEDMRSSAKLQQRLQDEWHKEARLQELRASVSITSDLFRDRYSVVVAGYAPTTVDRDHAIAAIPTILGIDKKDIVILDLVKLDGGVKPNL